MQKILNMGAAQVEVSSLPNKRVREFSSRAEFLRMRSKAIGSSDVSSVLGESKYKSRYELWLEKTSEEAQEEIPLQELPASLELGIRFEEVVLEMVLDRIQSEHKLASKDTSSLPSMFRPLFSFEHPIYTGCIASCDAIVFQSGRPIEIVEAKTTKGFAAKAIKRDGLPKQYFSQLQWQMGISGVHGGRAAILILDTGELLQYVVKFDEEYFSCILERVTEFQSLVETGEPPESVELYAATRSKEGATIEASAPILDVLAELDAKRDAAKILDEEIELLKDRIKIYMGEAEILTDNGQKLASWKTVDTTRFDSTRFKKAEPELYALFTKTSSSRTFRLDD